MHRWTTSFTAMSHVDSIVKLSLPSSFTLFVVSAKTFLSMPHLSDRIRLPFLVLYIEQHLLWNQWLSFVNHFVTAFIAVVVSWLRAAWRAEKYSKTERSSRCLSLCFESLHVFPCPSYSHVKRLHFYTSKFVFF